MTINRFKVIYDENMFLFCFGVKGKKFHMFELDVDSSKNRGEDESEGNVDVAAIFESHRCLISDLDPISKFYRRRFVHRL